MDSPGPLVDTLQFWGSPRTAWAAAGSAGPNKLGTATAGFSPNTNVTSDTPPCGTGHTTPDTPTSVQTETYSNVGLPALANSTIDGVTVTLQVVNGAIPVGTCHVSSL